MWTSSSRSKWLGIVPVLVAAVTCLSSQAWANRVIKTISLGQPSSAEPEKIVLNTATHRAYVVCESSATLCVIDTTTQSVLAHIPIPLRDWENDILVYPGRNKVYLTSIGQGAVTVVNGATNAVETTIPLPGEFYPCSLAVDAARDRLYVANRDSNSLSVIDCATNTVLSTVPVGYSPRDVAVNGAAGPGGLAGWVYVALEGQGSVAAVNPDTLAVTDIPLGPDGIGGPNNLGIKNRPPLGDGDPDKLYVAAWEGDVGVVNLETHGWIKNIAVPSQNLRCIAVFAAANRVYVSANWGGNYVYCINGATDTVEAAIKVEDEVSGLALHEARKKLYVADDAIGSVHVIDADPASGTFNTRIAEVEVCSDCHVSGVVVDEAADRAYAPDPDIDTVVIIDTAADVLMHGVSVGGGPGGSTVVKAVPGSGSATQLFVGHMGEYGLREIDTSTWAVTNWRTGFPHVGGDANQQDGWVYLTRCGGAGSPTVVTAIQLDTGAITTIPIARCPHGAVFHPATKRLYIMSIPYGGTPGNRVSVIDADPASPTFHTVLTVLPTGQFPVEMVLNPATGLVYVANSGSDSVTVIDGMSVAGTIAVSQEPDGLIVNASTNRIYVLHGDDGTIGVIDGATNTVTATLSISGGAELDDCQMAINDVTNRLYVSWVKEGSWGKPIITVVDLGTNTIIAHISMPLGGWDCPLAVNRRLNQIYAADGAASAVYIIDGNTNTIAHTIPVGREPGHIAVDEAECRLYVSNYGDNSISVIQLGVGRTVSHVIAPDSTTPGAGPEKVAVNEATRRAYVLNEASRSVSVINLDTETRIVNIPLLREVAWVDDIVVHEGANKVFVSNGPTDSVVVIDGSTNAVSGVIPCDQSPRDLELDEAGDRLFVSCFDQSRVLAFSTVTHARLATVDVGQNPWGMAYDAANNWLYVGCEGSASCSAIDCATYSPTWLDLGINGPRAVDIYYPGAPAQPTVCILGDTEMSIVRGGTAATPTPDFSHSISVGSGWHGEIKVVQSASHAYVGGRSGTVTCVRLDVTPESVSGTMPIGGDCTGFATIAALGRLYIADDAMGAVRVADVNPASGTFNTIIRTIPICNDCAATDIAAHQGLQRVYVPDPEIDCLVCMDEAVGLRTGVSVGGGPTTLDLGSLWATHTGPAGAWKVDTSTLAASEASAGYPHVSGAYDPTSGYLFMTRCSGANQAPHSITALRGSDLSATTLSVARCPHGSVVVDEARRRVYVASIPYGGLGGDLVTVIDADTRTVVGTVTTGGNPASLILNRTTGYVYTTNEWSNNVTAITGTAAVATIPLSSTSYDGDAYEARNRLYVFLENSTLAVIDCNTNAVVASIPLPSGQDRVRVNEATGKVYVACEREFLVIDGNTDAVITTTAYPVPSASGEDDRYDAEDPDIDFDNAAGVVYIMHDGVEGVFVIDSATDAIIDYVGVGWAPWAVKADPGAGRAYVSNHGSNSISVIENMGQVVVATHPGALTVSVNGVPRPTPYAEVGLVGATVSLTAATTMTRGPVQYVFDSWSDRLPQGHSATIAASVNTVTASYDVLYWLAAAVAPPGTGDVERVPDELGTLSPPASASGFYPEGSTVTLSAVPQPGYRFGHWLGALTGTANPGSVLMTQPLAVTATFVPDVVTLTVTKSGAGNGGILINGHARALPYSGSFATGTALTLTAVAGDGCAFVCWSGDAAGSANPIMISMAADRDVDVRFEHTVKTRFTTSPKAVPVYIDAVPHDTPCYPSFGAGSTHTVGVASPVTLTDYIKLTFSHWDPAADQWHVLTWPSVGMKYTAYYDALLKVTAEVSPPGSGTATLTPEAAGGWYSPGSNIWFFASPATGYEFWHWEFVKLGKTKNNPVVLDIGKSPVVAIAHMLAEGSGVDRPKAVSPVGEVPLAAVTFVWEGVDGARCYDLWVASQGSDAPVLTLDEVAACKTGAVKGLLAGDYVWWVRAQSGEGASGWSVPAHFSLRPEAVRQLPAPKPMAPLGEVASGALTFRWTSVPDATSYSLWVARASDGWPVWRRPGIAGAQCEVSLPAGKYRWAVSAGGPWSASVPLQVK